MDVISYQGVKITNPEILQKVIQQLNKDLSMCGYEYEFREDTNIDALIDEFEQWTIAKLEKDDDQLMNFLYRVDVNQKKIFSQDGLPQINFVKQVLLRELQKVVLRSQYSSSGDNLEIE